jgi:cysteine-rich repeat protein
VCGDGIPECGEGCDDGNTTNTDGCPDGAGGTCEPASCGDGFVQAGVEGCDDGDGLNNDSCPDGPGGTCQPAECGDNHLWDTDGGSEQCDDGNTSNGDGCDSNCQSESTCGDGIVEGLEECDGVNLNGQSCFTQGFHYGTLLCNMPGACTFNTINCAFAQCALSEGFEGSWLPSGWEVVDTNASYTWQKDSIAIPHSGISSAYVPWNYNQDETLISDYLACSGPGCQMTITFWIKASYSWAVDPNQNYEVFVWAVVGDWDAGTPDDDVLITNSAIEDNLNSSADDYIWIEASYPIPAALNGQGIRIAWQYVGDNADTLRIDDVLLTTVNCSTMDCGNGQLDAGEGCDDGDLDNTDDCPDDGVNGGTCQPATCGDGFVWAGNEGCDDGNGVNTDACPDGAGGTCQPAECGDNFFWGGVEGCEDGNTNNGDGCSSTCQIEGCGNGSPDAGEGCDDGDADNSDACPDGAGGTCQPATCGDYHVWDTDGGSEQCDDGNTANGDGCDSSCQWEATCGNGIPEGLEECDDGNTSSFDGCSCTCTWECGDGAKSPEEQCDDGNTSGGDGCDATCKLESPLTETEPNDTPAEAAANNSYNGSTYVAGSWNPVGDYDYYAVFVPPGGSLTVETFDSNGPSTCVTIDTQIYIYDTDGTTELAFSEDEGVGWCSVTTLVDLAGGIYYVLIREYNDNNTGDYTVVIDVTPGDCGNCSTGPGEQCDDGNLINCDGCSNMCQNETGCGDGSLCGAEVCDDGNTSDCDGCRGDCSAVETGCSDGFTCGAETCDDGNTNDCDGCSATCVTETGCGDGVICGAEECDDTNFGGLDCTDFGFDTGVLTCTGGCTIDTSLCDTVVYYYQENFDSGGNCNNVWTENEDWECGSPNSGPGGAYSGNRCLATVLNGDYSNGMEWNTCTVDSPSIDLTTASNPTLSWYMWIATEGSTYDGANLWVSTNGGGSWQRVDTVTPAYDLTIDGESAWGEDACSYCSSWYNFTADLSAYAGETIMIRFAFRSDTSVVYPGVYIDDVEIFE